MSQGRWYAGSGGIIRRMQKVIFTTRFSSVAGLLVGLRWLYVIGQCGLLALALLWLHLPLPVLAVGVCISVIVAGNLIATWRLIQWSSAEETSRYEIAAWLAFDLLMLTALLYWTGGSTNPFVSLYLLPVALAVIALPVRLAVLLAAFSALSYTLLLFWHVPVHAMHTNFNLHVNGMWVNFLLSALLLLLVVSTLVSRLRQRDAELAEAREQVIRDQQIVELGTVAAGTAHELGTPLTTLGLLLDDLPPNETTGLMAQQLEHCQQQLRQLLSTQATGMQPNEPLCVSAYLHDVFESCAVTHPKIQLQTHIADELAEVSIQPLLKVTQTLRSLFDNAAEASLANEHDKVFCQAALQHAEGESQLVITIFDQGTGLAITRQGDEPHRQKPKGSGVGLLLAQNVLHSLQGGIEFSRAEADEWTTKVTLQLPLSALRV